MVYSYLLQLYQELDRRREALETQLANDLDDADKGEYLRGRLATIAELKVFLTGRYHHKLPRRLQKKGN